MSYLFLFFRINIVMNFFAIVFLGFVQGICEFLPISSSGHLVLFSSLLGIEDSLFISIILHLATLFSVVVVFRKEVWDMIRHPFSKESMNVAISTICTCIITIIIMPFIESSFEGKILPITFFATAIILLLTERNNKKQKVFSKKNAVIVGLAQGLATLPGLSRSGTTIFAGLASGGNREESSKFSFLISLPIIIGSMILEIYKFTCEGAVIKIDFLPMLISFIISFIVGLFSIKLMLKILQKEKLKFFSIYLVILSIISAFIFW